MKSYLEIIRDTKKENEKLKQTIRQLEHIITKYKNNKKICWNCTDHSKLSECLACECYFCNKCTRKISGENICICCFKKCISNKENRLSGKISNNPN